MARQASNSTIKTEADDTKTPGLEAMGDALSEHDAALAAANENALAIAEQLSYDGAMTIGGIEDEIRFYQRRTAEACLELGKRLLILKELTPHGEFSNLVEKLGMHERMSRRFMQAALKFGKSDNLSVLTEKISSQSKLLELVTLDDDELESLADGESVRGVELDQIDTMTASELKAKLREAEANYQAQGKVLSDKSAQVDKLATELTAKSTRVEQTPPDEVAKELRSQALTDAFAAEHAIASKLAATFNALQQHTADHGGDHKQFMLGLLVNVQLEAVKVIEQFNLTSDADKILNTEPWWLKDDAVAAAEANNQALLDSMQNQEQVN